MGNNFFPDGKYILDGSEIYSVYNLYFYTNVVVESEIITELLKQISFQI